MLRGAEVGAGEVAVGEPATSGAQAAQVGVGEAAADEAASHPLLVREHRVGEVNIDALLDRLVDRLVVCRWHVSTLSALPRTR